MEQYFIHLADTCAPEPIYEFFYARKCYNIRHKFFECGFAEDGTEKRIYIKDIPTVIDKVLKYFLEEDNWRVDGDSIWEWYNMLPQIADAIKYLKMFLEDLQCEDEEYSEDDFYIFFYDSY